MELVVLIENSEGCAGCAFEHGLSVYLESGAHRVMLDFGASESVIANAQRLGVDLSRVDCGFLSHGHYDHSGGILAFLKLAPQAKVYVQDTAFRPYYCVDAERNEYIGINPEIEALPNVVRLRGDAEIDPDISVFTGITGRRAFAKGNRILKVEERGTIREDDFCHEQCVVIREGEKTLLFSGCAHNGILNILDEFRRRYGKNPTAVLTGFHMMQPAYSEEDLERDRQVARELMGMNTVFFSGHCTGDIPFAAMKEVMGDQLVRLHTGMKITL